MPTTSYVAVTTSVRGIGARTDAAGVAVDDISAEEDRLAHALLTEGGLTATAFQVAASSGMDLLVGSGTAKADRYVVTGEVAGQENYVVRLDATTVTVTVPAADASLARTDEVYLIVADAPYDGGSVSLPRIGYRKGDAGGGAPGPDTSWKASAKLATVAVGAAVTSITGANITDNRSLATLPLAAAQINAIFTSDSTEWARDIVGAVVTAGTGISVAVSDVGNTVTVANTGLGSAATTAPAESTAVSTYGDLTTAGPAVTKTTGTSVAVWVSAEIQALGVFAYMGVEVSGASTIAAADADALMYAHHATGGFTVQIGSMFIITGLNAGSNTFTAKYKAVGGSASFGNRNLLVMRLD